MRCVGSHREDGRVTELTISSGAWLVGSTYMIFSLGEEIISGLAGPSERAKEE